MRKNGNLFAVKTKNNLIKTPLSFLLIFLFLLFSAQEKEYSCIELKKELNNKTFVALISGSCAEPIGMKYTYCELTFMKNIVSVLYTMKLNDTVLNVSSLPKKYKWKLLNDGKIEIINFKEYGNFNYISNNLIGTKIFKLVN